MLTDILRGLIASVIEFEVVFSVTYWSYRSSTLQWSRSLMCLKFNSDYSRELYITIPAGIYYTFFFQKYKFTYAYLELILYLFKFFIGYKLGCINFYSSFVTWKRFGKVLSSFRLWLLCAFPLSHEATWFPRLCHLWFEHFIYSETFELLCNAPISWGPASRTCNLSIYSTWLMSQKIYYCLCSLFFLPRVRSTLRVQCISPWVRRR